MVKLLGEKGRTALAGVRGDSALKPQQLAEWVLLMVGVFLLLFPVAVAAMSPTVLINAQTFLRIIAALGGALVGGFIPGALQITLPGVKAVGAIGIFGLVYATNPAVIVAAASNPMTPATTAQIAASSTSEQLRNWLYPTGAETPPDAARLATLSRWMQRSGFSDLPVATLVYGGQPALERGRQAAISDLHIP